MQKGLVTLMLMSMGKSYFNFSTAILMLTAMSILMLREGSHGARRVGYAHPNVSGWSPFSAVPAKGVLINVNVEVDVNVN